MKDQNEKTIYELEMHEEIFIATGKKAMRVPGGWIYTTIQSFYEGTTTISQTVSTTFVPLPENENSRAEKGSIKINKPPSKPKGLNFGG